MKQHVKIIRIWRGWTTPENAPKYLQLLREEVFPDVIRNGVTGLEQVRFTTRELPGEVEFLLSLQFDCLDSVRKFAGENYRMAYIPENARKVLLRYDAFAEHYELAGELQLSPRAQKKPTMENNPIVLSKESFRQLGHQLIDAIADFNSSIQNKPVTYGRLPSEVQAVLGQQALPQGGTDASDILSEATAMLFNHSLFNGHPRFLGYITSSPTPIGALADLLAATVNPNTGAHLLSPVATEIEKQTIGWLAELIGVAPTYRGILVSGGNMANFTGFLAGRTAMSPASLKSGGLRSLDKQQVVYCSKTTHTWVEKAAALFGMGTDAIRWIDTNSDNRMNISLLEASIQEDITAGCQPMMVVGTAGDVSTGTVDDLQAIARLCKTYDLWFHVDGAYGIPAAVVPEYQALFTGLDAADSIALDPHKWLYSPLEAGCTLVKNPKHLTDTFSSHPEYYAFDSQEGEFAQNFYEYGLQNSRGFRALKVWMGLRQLGRNGYAERIAEDIRLAAYLSELAAAHPQLQAMTHNLSITTFRYIPPGYSPDPHSPDPYLNILNEKLLGALQKGGEAFLSNAIVRGHYCLRGCIVNFRTTATDIEAIIKTVVDLGNRVHSELEKNGSK